jgi:cell division transport system permease protein
LFTDKQLVNLVNDNIKKSEYVDFNNQRIPSVYSCSCGSLRLSIHSNRFIIKTMQMVGATKSFIRKPFVMRSIKLGMLGAGLAIIALIGVAIRRNQLS